MSELLREKFERNVNAPPGPPLEVTAELLRRFVADCEPEETRRAIEDLGRDETSRFLARALSGLETLLVAPPGEQELIDLVEWQGGKVLEEPRGENAVRFLGDLAGMIREAIGKRGG